LTNFLNYDIIYIVKERSTPQLRCSLPKCERKRYNMANVTFKTEREFLNAVIEANVSEAISEFAKGRIAAIDKSNENRKNGTSKAALATAEKRQEIFDGMEFDKTYTAKEIADTFGLGSTQKATGLLSKIDGLVVADFSPTGKKKDTVKGYTKPSAQ
jgi:hypothetical protein